MPLEFISSEKGKDAILDNGHRYLKERTYNGKTYWKCTNYDSMNCRARVHSNGESVIKRIGEHNHAADAASLNATKLVNEMKNRAVNSQDSGHQIITGASVGLSNATAAKLPQISSIKRTLRRVRQGENHALPNPLSRIDLEIPAEFSITETGEEFLLYDNGKINDRILIFSIRRNLRLLAASQHWYMDGTFKTAPALFEQLYTIHGIRFNNVIPAVFALLPNKSELTYSHLFDQLKILEPTVAPQSIMTDFELSAINAIGNHFPNANRRGCFFHFNQSIYRHIQSNGLQHRYETDGDFALQIRMLPALAFVPTGNIVQAFDDLIDHGQFLLESQPVVDYFEDTWIGRPNRGNRRRLPRFPHDLWNCYDAVIDGLPKTNNSVEGWHRGFVELVGGHHPTIWKFISSLKLEQSRNEAVIEQYLAGQEPPTGKKKYPDCAKRIERIVATYDQVDLIDYLRGLSHNFNF